MLNCIKCNKAIDDTLFIVNSGICDDCLTKRFEVPNTLRRSDFDTYEKCPYQFKKLVIERDENKISTESEYTLVGTILHELFEEHSVKRNYTKETMYEKFIKEFGSIKAIYNTDDDLIEKLKQRGKTSISNYIDWEGNQPVPRDVEINLLFYIEGVKSRVSITIDRIQDLGDEGYDILDYKTGKTYVGKELEHNIQVPMYIHGATKHYGKAPNSFKLLFVGEGKERIYKRIDDDNYVCTVRGKQYKMNIPSELKRYEKIYNNIVNGNFSVSTKVGFYYCEHFCPVYKAKLCKGSSEQSWNMYK